MKRFTAALRALAVAATLVCGLAVPFAASAATDNEYLLGAGDAIRVAVFQNPDLTIETRITESGEITYPLLGQVQVGGLTVARAESRIAAALRDGGFVMKPQVNILLTQIRGNQVSVVCMVGRPGRFPLELSNTRLTDVIALAGGILPQGADTAVITGLRDGKPMRTEVDIAGLFLDQGGSRDITLRNGDVVYVHRAPNFYIYGEVQRPGAFRVERNMTVMQALAQGGGLTPRGTTRSLEIHRRDTAGAVQKLEPKLEDPIRADDVLVVRESLF